jgi:hypothetical protein
MDNPYLRLTHEFNDGRLSEDRLGRYLQAAAAWGTEWPRLAKQLAGQPLATAHEMMVAEAVKLLPQEP